MNIEQKNKVLKVLNDFFNEADTSKMSLKRTIEISESIDLVKNLHIPVVMQQRELLYAVCDKLAEAIHKYPLPPSLKSAIINDLLADNGA